MLNSKVAMNVLKNQKGISLVEVLLYMALFSMFLASVFSISFLFTKQIGSSRVRTEMDLGTIVLMEAIKSKLSEGAVIEVPKVGATSTILVLNNLGMRDTFESVLDSWKLPSGANISGIFKNIIFERRKDEDEGRSGQQLLYISADNMIPIAIST